MCIHARKDWQILLPRLTKPRSAWDSRLLFVLPCLCSTGDKETQRTFHKICRDMWSLKTVRRVLPTNQELPRQDSVALAIHKIRFLRLDSLDVGRISLPLTCESKADLLYASDHPRVANELQRLQLRARQSKETKRDAGEVVKRWMTTHKQLADDCFLTWVLLKIVPGPNPKNEIGW